MSELDGDAEVGAVALQSDGGIVVGGGFNLGEQDPYAVYRYRPTARPTRRSATAGW